MLDGTNQTTSTDQAVAEIQSAHVGGRGEGGIDWRAADRALRTIARRRAALDLEEAAWLVRAQRAQVHRHRGFGSFLEYLERVLGYGPRVALDRLRVAEALELFPSLRAAVAEGLPFSAARELVRVVVPDTVDQWLVRGVAPALAIRFTVEPAPLREATEPRRTRRAAAAPAPTPAETSPPVDDLVRATMVQLGYKPGPAWLAIRRARAHVGGEADFNAVLREALKAALQKP